MTMDDMKNIVIEFENGYNAQTVKDITKYIGLVKAESFVSIIDNLNLEANPRSSKTGAVTDAIQKTIEEKPYLFPFMSKGVLLAAAEYEVIIKNKSIKILPDDPQIEGILDGGHNTLAIGLYILKQALAYSGETLPRGSKKWDDFKKLWQEKRSLIQKYLEESKKKRIKILDFLVPVELVVPRDVKDIGCWLSFKNNLLDICEARNNNAELQLSAKANQKGYFDELKRLMNEVNPSLVERIEWKTNDGGKVKVQDLIALAWIPLNLIGNQSSSGESAQKNQSVSPTVLYSSKKQCLKMFEKLMSSSDVTDESGDGYKRTLLNEEVKSALKIAVEIPRLYDYIYKEFPSCYNAAGGKFNAIIAVKAKNEKEKNKMEPFSGKPITQVTPEGFIVPLVYGLQALIEKSKKDGYWVLCWKEDPMTFLQKNLKAIVANYYEIFSICNYDPQKVGKALHSYNTALNAFKMALAGI